MEMKMKKINLLAVLAALLLSACGGSGSGDDITKRFNQTWNVNEDIVRGSDGSITYYSIAWGGLVASLRDSEKPVDWSGYEQIVFEFSGSVEVGLQVIINDKIMANASPGVTELHCSLQGLNKAALELVSLQTSKPTELHIKRIYLSTEPMPSNTLSVWDGECISGNWANGLNVPADRFATVEEGDQLEIVYTTDNTTDLEYWQMKAIYSGVNELLEGNADDQNEWGCVTLEKNSTSYTITLTANDAARLKETGLFVNGYYLVVTQVNLLQSEELRVKS